MYSITTLQPPIVTSLPIWTPGMFKRDVHSCGFDSHNSSISCGYNSPQTIITITTSSSIPNDELITPTLSPSTTSYSPTTLLSNIKPSATSTTFQPNLPEATDPSASNPLSTQSSSAPSDTTVPSNTPQAKVPLAVVPSTLVVLFAIIGAAIANRRRWFSQAYRTLIRSPRFRRTLTASPSTSIGFVTDTPTRDIESPPPAYSPYQPSWADREIIGDPNARESRYWVIAEAMSHAYPMGDRGRYRST